jgi:hypothetical protein
MRELLFSIASIPAAWVALKSIRLIGKIGIRLSHFEFLALVIFLTLCGVVGFIFMIAVVLPG